MYVPRYIDYRDLEGEFQNLRLGKYIKLGIVQKVYELPCQGLELGI